MRRAETPRVPRDVLTMTAAAFPWIFVAAYFVLVMLPPGSISSWAALKESLLAGRFAAPTFAGVLFAILAAAGLSATWLFKKTRILAIFDDLDTVLLMIPLEIMMVGFAWQLGLVVVVMAVFLYLARRYLHRPAVPVSWTYVLGYAFAIAVGSEILYQGSKLVDDSVPIHIEVLLPAFVPGCMLKRPESGAPHSDDDREGHQEGPESPGEQRASTIVAVATLSLTPNLLLAGVFILAVKKLLRSAPPPAQVSAAGTRQAVASDLPGT